jgi:hypothetical protein
VRFNGFLKLKLCIPSAKNELLHGILLLRNVDHDILQKRHLKSLLTIANFFGVVIRFFSNLLWNPFNITTLLMIYIEDCRSEYRTKESQAQEIFTLETINLIFFPPKLKAFWPGNKEINGKKFELLLILPLCLVYTRSDPEYSTNVFYIRSSKGAYIIYIV